jgi:hypothetical protein
VLPGVAPRPGGKGTGRGSRVERGRPHHRRRRRVGRIGGADEDQEETDLMPTDHGPELEALRKRLADAKEFL